MKYHVSQDREFASFKTLSRTEARKLLRKVVHAPEVVLDAFETGRLQIMDLSGWGWIRPEPRARVKGMVALRRMWRNAGIEAARDVLHKRALEAAHAGRLEEQKVLEELGEELRKMRKD